MASSNYSGGSSVTSATVSVATSSAETPPNTYVEEEEVDLPKTKDNMPNTKGASYLFVRCTVCVLLRELLWILIIERPIQRIWYLHKTNWVCFAFVRDYLGFCDVARANTELPSELLERLLLKDETVIGQFDTFYPTPTWSRRWTVDIYTAYWLCLFLWIMFFLLFWFFCTSVRPLYKQDYSYCLSSHWWNVPCVSAAEVDHGGAAKSFVCL